MGTRYHRCPVGAVRRPPPQAHEGRSHASSRMLQSSKRPNATYHVSKPKNNHSQAPSRY
ncbi:hypothetical protein PAXRUDRAFT_826669 [Paxillus rubicundulus Ve08.2h10]|uniref:Uncharacterized protein n=1 Tax=Paxillus rubicundulus Ve08.2h10 TaxID=930991 RepID=A0A0D0E3Z5_9AGAM|nr:hypothetical protein PAXRUDRAFT_826669 [Paxillus rubicundulus Ve08.2h10]